MIKNDQKMSVVATSKRRHQTFLEKPKGGEGADYVSTVHGSMLNTELH